jgi:hypothetical protein
VFGGQLGRLIDHGDVVEPQQHGLSQFGVYVRRLASDQVQRRADCITEVTDHVGVVPHLPLAKVEDFPRFDVRSGMTGEFDHRVPSCCCRRFRA